MSCGLHSINRFSCRSDQRGTTPDGLHEKMRHCILYIHREKRSNKKLWCSIFDLDGLEPGDCRYIKYMSPLGKTIKVQNINFITELPSVIYFMCVCFIHWAIQM